ncbi:MAG: hypothetical protein RX318_03870 [bacterium]|nr:hypothetical protein [bacterium]
MKGMETMERAAEDAGKLADHARRWGVPASVVVVLLVGTVWGVNLNNRVDVIEAREIPDLKQAVEKFERSIQDLREGRTEYQKRQERALDEIKQTLQKMNSTRPWSRRPSTTLPQPRGRGEGTPR